MLSLWTKRVFWLSVGAMASVGFFYLLFLGRGFTYALDEWMFVARGTSWSKDTLLAPHNGHISVLAAAIYVAVFRTFGLNHPEIFRVIVLVMQMGCAVCVGLLVSRRHGRSIAVWAGLLVMFLGKGAQNIVWGFQIGMTGSVLFFLVAMVLIDRWEVEPRRSRLILASIALSASILLGSVGLPAIAAVTAYVLLSRRRGDVWWVPIPSVVVYAVWYTSYSVSLPVITKVGPAARWTWGASRDALAAFFDAGDVWGGVLASALLTLMIHGAVRRTLPLRLVAWLTFVFVFWGLTSTARWFVPTDSPRYLHVAMIGLVMVVSDACPDLRSRRSHNLPWYSAGTAVVVVVSIALQFPTFRFENVMMRNYYSAAPSMRGTLGAIELLGDNIDPSLPIVKFGDTSLISVGEYMRAVRSARSSPAVSPLALATSPLPVRQGADFFLNMSRVVEVQPATDTGCTAEPPRQSITISGGGSLRVRNVGANGFVVRRFLSTVPVGVTATELPAGTSMIAVPIDDVTVPWVLVFSSPMEQLSCPTS